VDPTVSSPRPLRNLAEASAGDEGMKWLFALTFLALAGSAFGADEARFRRARRCSTIGAQPVTARTLPGTVALQTKYKGAQTALLSERTDLTPAVTKTLYGTACRSCLFSQDRNQRCGFRRAGRVPGSQQQTSEPVAHPLALAVRM